MFKIKNVPETFRTIPIILRTYVRFNMSAYYVLAVQVDFFGSAINGHKRKILAPRTRVSVCLTLLDVIYAHTHVNKIRVCDFQNHQAYHYRK